MAITPRTILTSAAPATVAVVSLYFFTVLGTAAYKYLEQPQVAPQPQPISTLDAGPAACDQIAQHFGDNRAQWSELGWVHYTHCFDRHQDSERAIAAASQGLRYYPRSETLYNFKAYHQIVSGEHAQAIDTLRLAMTRVSHHRNGVMHNNLAWAGLWEPRKVRLNEARELYQKSLSIAPATCEVVHTGLFVEFTIANKAHGLERFDALKRFNQLRQRYQGCFNRLNNGDWTTTVELVGAAVLFNEVDGSNRAQPQLDQVARKLVSQHPQTSAQEVCAEAIPMADFHHTCVDLLENKIRMIRAQERERNHAARNQRARHTLQVIDQQGRHHTVINTNQQQHRRVQVGCGTLN